MALTPLHLEPLSPAGDAVSQAAEPVRGDSLQSARGLSYRRGRHETPPPVIQYKVCVLGLVGDNLSLRGSEKRRVELQRRYQPHQAG